MISGQDLSDLFATVVKNVACKSIEVSPELCLVPGPAPVHAAPPRSRCVPAARADAAAAKRDRPWCWPSAPPRARRPTGRRACFCAPARKPPPNFFPATFCAPQLKKLVYQYVVRYAEQMPDIALLSIASFQKGLKVRARTTTAMCRARNLQRHCTRTERTWRRAGVLNTSEIQGSPPAAAPLLRWQTPVLSRAHPGGRRSHHLRAAARARRCYRIAGSQPTHPRERAARALEYPRRCHRPYCGDCHQHGLGRYVALRPEVRRPRHPETRLVRFPSTTCLEPTAPSLCAASAATCPNVVPPPRPAVWREGTVSTCATRLR